MTRLGKRLLVIAALACGPLLACGGLAGAQQYLGEMRQFTDACPAGWVKPEGQIMEFTSNRLNQALYSLLGTQYGGDGRTTFALPQLAGTNWCIALKGQFPSQY